MQQEISGSAVISLLVDNESGALARIVELFSGRGYNIQSLTVAPVDEQGNISRVNIVTTGTASAIRQVKVQIERLVPVSRVVNLSDAGPYVAREMALVKVVSSGESRTEALRIAEAFRARAVDTTATSFVFELTGSSDKLDSFIDLMRPLGLAEVSRTGVASICRGPKTIQNF
ncbi:acetolactate synthase small subunit [Acetobacter suratthaniensis]|uniref:Acetolactate synthase small subunit n=1 Tax=Acetobacter suratthaniensis TaxID=1502841 RepID=A0ABS3LN45_9PROT|nr:acetolactate synthase small subunit [Acetobacter suratthaniensis]MBO1328784.1 acetolactate synthase small subunit [Acetobacter suratthaniensis]MCX2565829.1 acetolactate synthase small subunit [Acetobacter suratthaniensis]